MVSKKKATAKGRATKSDTGNPRMEDVFQKVKEDDAQEVKLSAAAQRVKQCHLLATEAQMLLQCARKETATSAIIDAELKRVIELAGEMVEEAKKARSALKR